MSEPGQPSSNMAALVEALDARAKQAGTEGAATVLRGMLGTLSETLSGIEDRLDRVDASLAHERGAGAGSDQIHTALSALSARLGRLEEAFVQAVEESGSGTDAVVDQIRRAVVDSLREERSALPPTEPPAPPPEFPDVSELLRPIVDALSERLGGIEDGIDRRLADTERAIAELAALAARPLPEPPPPPPPPPPVEVHPVDLEPVLQRIAAVRDAVDELAARPLPEPPPAPEPAVPPPPPPPVDVRPAVADAIAPLLARLSQLENQVRRVADAPAPAPHATNAGDAMVERLEQAIDDLRRDEGTARVVGLVEERIAAVVRAVADRAEAIRRDVATLGDERGELRRRLEEMQSAVRTTSTSAERSAKALDGIVEQVAERVLAALRPVVEGAVGAIPAADDTRVVDALRRESELLTQRVAALAVGVEATRAMVEQLVDATEGSLGRKAGEVGRRLAADLGLRPRRPVAGRRERELGPGPGPERASD